MSNEKEGSVTTIIVAIIALIGTLGAALITTKLTNENINQELQDKITDIEKKNKVLGKENQELQEQITEIEKKNKALEKENQELKDELKY